VHGNVGCPVDGRGEYLSTFLFALALPPLCPIFPPSLVIVRFHLPRLPYLSLLALLFLLLLLSSPFLLSFLLTSMEASKIFNQVLHITEAKPSLQDLDEKKLNSLAILFLPYIFIVWKFSFQKVKNFKKSLYDFKNRRACSNFFTCFPILKFNSNFLKIYFRLRSTGTPSRLPSKPRSTDKPSMPVWLPFLEI
jgi:hypothetical protein